MTTPCRRSTRISGLPHELRRYLDETRARIDEHGWALISTALPDRPDVPMAYTVGCEETLQRPELVVVGLPPYMGLTVLDRVAEGWRAGGDWAVDEPERGVLENHPVRLVRVPPAPAREHLRVANVLGAEAYRVLQVLWPDPLGRFPGDPLWEMRTRLRQPVLSHPPAK